MPTGPNQHWSMDFVHGQLLDGRSVRISTVIDQWSCESVCLEAIFRQTGRGVGQALDRSAVQRGLPRAITVDDGTEFTSRALDDWAYRRGIKLDYTRPGKPTDNGLIESFNGRLRDEFLNVHEFITLHDLQQKLRAWQDDYNHHRLHGSLGHLTPRELGPAPLFRPACPKPPSAPATRPSMRARRLLPPAQHAEVLHGVGAKSLLQTRRKGGGGAKGMGKLRLTSTVGGTGSSGCAKRAHSTGAMPVPLKELNLVRVLPGWELPRAMLYALFESRVLSARAIAFIDVFKAHLHAHMGASEAVCDGKPTGSAPMIG